MFEFLEFLFDEIDFLESFKNEQDDNLVLKGICNFGRDLKVTRRKYLTFT